MATKINSIRNQVSQEGIMLTSWLETKGISRSDLSNYVKHNTLKRVATGVYKYPETELSLYGILSSYQTQENLRYHLGAATALELKGFSHYIPMGKPQAVIFTPRTKPLPKWILSTSLDMTIVDLTTKVFPDIGIANIHFNGNYLKVSSPERAIMECLLMYPMHTNLQDVYYLMEMLNALRSTLVQKLLEECTSIKVKRLFLYLAEKARHRWFDNLDLSKISLGSGTRSLVSGGVKNSKYDIMIPKELVYYEGNILEQS